MIKNLLRRLRNLYRLSNIDIDRHSLDLTTIRKIYIETLDLTDKDIDTYEIGSLHGSSSIKDHSSYDRFSLRR
jgi:hypothetical protein